MDRGGIRSDDFTGVQHGWMGDKGVVADANAHAQDEDEVELDFERHPLTEDFFEALKCLRMSPSHPEIANCLAQFRPPFREYFCKVLALILTKIRENVAAEFRAICEEAGLFGALSALDSNDVSETYIGQSISPQGVIREVAMNKKKEELNALHETLRKVKDDNAVLSIQLGELQEKTARAQHLRSLTDKVSSINSVVQKAMK